jgi:lipid-binding SYLF domain-containing protein
MLKTITLFLICCGLMLPAHLLAAPGERDHVKGLKKATEVIEELGARFKPETRAKAECVSVLTLGKGGFFIGGTGGRGFLTCKVKGKKSWSAPVILDIGGGSMGPQIGGAKVELIMVFTNVRDVEDIARTTPVFSGKASATAGDRGTGVSGGGDPNVVGDVITVSRSKGLYAGAVGETLVITPHEDETEEFLGSSLSLVEVLVEGKVRVPESGRAFVDAVSKWHRSK